MNWITTITFVIYATISILLMASYFYFVFFQKDKHAKDQELKELSASKLVNRVTREWWMWITNPVEEYLVQKKFHPNTLTFLGLAITTLSFIGYSFGWFVFAGWCVLIGGTMDIFDGRIARRLGKTSKSGEFLDANMDRIGESLIFLGLLNYYTNTLFFYIVFTAFVASQMVSYAKARGESLSIEAKVGLMQRPERIVWIGVPSVLSPLFGTGAHYFFPISNTWLASVGITVVAIMSSYTFYERFTYISKKLS